MGSACGILAAIINNSCVLSTTLVSVVAAARMRMLVGEFYACMHLYSGERRATKIPTGFSQISVFGSAV